MVAHYGAPNGQASTGRTLVPVDHDPFAANQPKLGPVDYDPFAAAPNAGSDQPGFLSQAARALRMGLPFGDRFVAAEKTYLPQMLGGNGQDYATNLANERGADQALAKAHPFLTGTGQAIGGMALPVGAAGAASQAATLGGKALAGAGAGAVIGGIQGASDSPDLTNGSDTLGHVARGAGFGFGLGGAMPLLGRGVGAAYTAVADKMAGNASGLSKTAQQHLIDALMADGAPKVQSEISRLGDSAMLADAGPAFLGKAQGASLNSDEGRSIMARALMERNESTNARLNSDVNAAIGPAEDPALVTKNILAHRSEVDAANYTPALQNAPPVDTTGVAATVGQALDKAIPGSMEHKALTNVRQMLMDQKEVPVLNASGKPILDQTGAPVMRTQPAPRDNAEQLHKLKGELDSVIEYDAPGLGVPAAALQRQQAALKTIRGKLNAALEGQVPGYAAANAQSAGLAKRAEAVQTGTSLLDSGKTAMTPENLAGQYAGMQPGEQAAMAKGLRGEIGRLLATKQNDLVAGKNIIKGDTDWNQARMNIVFGEEPTSKVVNAVDREGRFANTYNKVVENSQTAQRTAAANAMKPPSPGAPGNSNAAIVGATAGAAFGGLPGGAAGAIGGAAANAAKKYGVPALLRALQGDPTKAYGEVARVLSAQGSERDRYIKALADVLDQRGQNAARAPTIGDRAALVAGLLGNGAYRAHRLQNQGR
jgi:hypothetical protein